MLSFRPFPLPHSICFLTVAIASFTLASCSPDSDRNLDPDELGGPSRAPSSGLQHVGVIPTTSSLGQVVASNGLVPLGYLKDSRTLLFEAPTGYDPNDFDASGDNEDAEGTDIQTGLVSFFEEKGLGTGSTTGQQMLDCLDLGVVHGTATGRRVKIAVLDTGVDQGHPHFAGKMTVVNDPVLGLAELDGSDDPGDDGYDHGTHVCGVILNVAPGAHLFPFKVLEETGIGNVYDLIAGIDAAIREDVDVINMSLSVNGVSMPLRKAMERATNAGIHVVAAAGNTGGTPVFPATDSFVYGVAATTNDDCDLLASFSGYDAVDISFATVGDGVLGALARRPGHTYPISEGNGTSTATAVATGCFALMLDDFVLGFDPIGDLETSALPQPQVSLGVLSPKDALGL